MSPEVRMCEMLLLLDEEGRREEDESRIRTLNSEKKFSQNWRKVTVDPERKLSRNSFYTDLSVKNRELS